jgi:hypothetical protein
MQGIRRWVGLLALGGVLCGLPVTAHAALELIVVIRDMRFEGNQVAVIVELRPFGLAERGVKLPLIARAAVNPDTCADDLKTYAIARAQSEYAVTLVASEITILGGCQ